MIREPAEKTEGISAMESTKTQEAYEIGLEA